MRVVGYGGAGQDTEPKAYFEPFAKLSGIKVMDFDVASINKVKAMVETKDVEWDVVRLSRGACGMTLSSRSIQ